MFAHTAAPSPRARTPCSSRKSSNSHHDADSQPGREPGYKVGIFSLGGQAALERPNNDAVAVPIVEKALDLGVNYIDTSSIYGGPERWSERYIGQVMKRRRAETFLATKTKERTRDGSLRMIEESLKLLQTDHVDLWQLHDIGIQPNVDEIFAKGGAMEALLEMRDQKVVRYLGVTGHYRPEPLMDAIHRHPFDTILMAVNAADKYHYSFSDQLLPLAVEKQMGIIGMKVPARGRLLSTWTPPAHRPAKTFMGRYGGAGAHPRHVEHARSRLLRPFASGQHDHHRLRFDCTARGKRDACSRIHAVERHTDGFAERQSGVGLAAVTVLPLLQSRVGRSIQHSVVGNQLGYSSCHE